MTDIELAKDALSAHSIALYRNGEIITDDGRGISPIMKFIAECRQLAGYSAADVIVWKAAAMLFVKAGVTCVHGNTMSHPGKEFLESHGIACTYDVLTERIIRKDNQPQRHGYLSDGKDSRRYKRRRSRV